MNWVFLLRNVPCRFLWLSKHPRAFLDNQGLNPKYFKKEEDEGKIISHAFLYFTGVAACPLTGRSHEDSYPKKHSLKAPRCHFLLPLTLGWARLSLQRRWSCHECEGDTGSQGASRQQ